MKYVLFEISTRGGAHPASICKIYDDENWGNVLSHDIERMMKDPDIETIKVERPSFFKPENRFTYTYSRG